MKIRIATISSQEEMVITGEQGSDRIDAKGGDDILTIDGWDKLSYVDPFF